MRNPPNSIFALFYHIGLSLLVNAQLVRRTPRPEVRVLVNGHGLGFAPFHN